MNKIKNILFLLFLGAFIALLVLSLLLPDKTYEQISDRLFGNSTTNTQEVSRSDKQSVVLPKPPINAPIKASKTVAKQTTPNSTPTTDSSIQVIEGFDWRLPSYAKRSDLSGLISEFQGAEEYVRADFHMVRWDKTNPQQNRYDFSELEK